MNSACVNWRGMQHKLKTPKWYSNVSEQDFVEAIKHLKVVLEPSKIYAIGVSLGGSVLSKAIISEKIDGAVVMNAPIDFPVVMDHLKIGFHGYLNWAFGIEFIKTLLPHENDKEIVEAFKKEHGLDIPQLI